MNLIQILLPLYDNEGNRLPSALFDEVRRELTDRYGGVTAFTRSPAEGFWKVEGEGTSRDDIVVIEVMTQEVDRTWWRKYRERLEAGFRQESVIVRTHAAELL